MKKPLVIATIITLLAACGGGGSETPPQNNDSSNSGDNVSPPGNNAPTLLVDAQISHKIVQGQVDGTISLTKYFTDPDGDTLRYEIVNPSSELMINNSELFFGENISVGSHDIQIIAIDDHGAESSPLSIKLEVISSALPNINIRGANSAYLTNATVTLEANLETTPHYPISYNWSQISGDRVEFMGSTQSEKLEFVVPENFTAQELTFGLEIYSDYNQKSERAKIAVYPPLMIADIPSLTANGDPITVEVTGGNGNKLNYESLNANVATIDDNGLLTPVTEGTAEVKVTQHAAGLFPELYATATAHVEAEIDNTVYVDVPVNITNNNVKAFSAPIVNEDKDTTFATYATATFDDKEQTIELDYIDNAWKGVLKHLPAGKAITLTTYSLDFAGSKTYQQSQDVTVSEAATEIQIQQDPVEPEYVNIMPIDRCENYVDDKGNIYPIIKSESIREDGIKSVQWGYYKEREFIRHHDCQPAYLEYYPSGNIKNKRHFLHDINHNNGKISTIHYLDKSDENNNPIKSIEYRYDTNGHYIVLDDQPSEYQYYSNGNIRYKIWKEGKDGHYAREFGPDSIGYNENGTYSSMIWHNAEQVREKQSVFNDDGTVQWCKYLDPQTNVEMHYSGCQVTDISGAVIKTEADLDRQYGIDTNEEPIIEPINECTHYIDESGIVYPIQSQVSASGYTTTGYYKDGQYVYHNQCTPAMTRFYPSSNPEHAWIFREGVNTNPDGYTSFAYYDATNSEGEPLLEMESKIENGAYIIDNDKPSVIKYYMNGDIQYQSWMKTDEHGNWVYGRDSGPDIINYSYDRNGNYHPKDIYWYNQAGEKLKRKYFDSKESVGFCHYYQFDAVIESDNACQNESTLDEQFQIK